MIIEKKINFTGQHCETTAVGSLLNFLDINLSEPMLFGIGEGLGFIYWDMKNMFFPFLGGRIKPDAITDNICKNLNLQLLKKETSSRNKAWQNVKINIDNGIPVGLKLDCYHLEYFTNKIHFAAHYAAIYGYDEKYAYLIDTSQQGGNLKTSLESLALARNEKGIMSSKNLSYTIENSSADFNLKKIIITALKNNAADYLNPPITNIGYKGIEKTSKMIKKWFTRSKNIKEDLTLVSILMEKAGTGGALFRNLYRDFLKESLTVCPEINIKNVYEKFCDIAKLWNCVSDLIFKAGQTSEQSYLNQASDLLLEISIREKEAMLNLL